MTPPKPDNESERIAALCGYEILDTAPEESFDDLAKLAAYICGAPFALLSLLDESRQWFKARIGVEQQETARDISFCAHGILQDEVMIVPDATKDARFRDSPLVTGDPYIHFYAGAPLITTEGHALGMLCVTDRKPRDVTVAQADALRLLARQAVAQLELRKRTREREKLITELQESLGQIKTLSGLIPICGWCKSVRSDTGYWQTVEEYVRAHSQVVFSHGICPDCTEKVKADLHQNGNPSADLSFVPDLNFPSLDSRRISQPPPSAAGKIKNPPQ